MTTHDVVTVTDGPYAGMAGLLLSADPVTVWCHGFEPFVLDAHQVERAKPAPFHTRGYDAGIGERIAVEIELARACRGLRHVIHDEDQHARQAVCVSCGEQLDLGV